MPSPSSSIQRPDLGAAYEEFDLMAHMQGFVGLRLFPQTPVALQAANFSKVSLEHLLNDGRNVKRAPGSGYARQDWQFEQDNYSADERGAEELMDDRERAAYGYTGIRFEQIASDRAVSALLRDLEIEIQAIVQDATTYASATTGVTTEWDTHASATPVADVLAARERFKVAGGVYPNTIVMSSKVFSNVIQTAELQDYIKYGGSAIDPTMVGVEGLAQVFQIANVVVAGAVKNTANAGATASLADVFDDEWVTLLQVAQTDDLRSMTFGRTFSWQDLVIEMYRDETVRADVLRARMDLDVKVIHSELIQILSNITT